ncbi:MAG: histidine kinase, partial [Bacteroidales bacterium]|nr:histidine kinase [Bacteroidales bacterium]
MKNKKTLIILLHILGWSLFFLLPYFLLDLPEEYLFSPRRTFTLLTALLFFYLNYFIFIPKFLVQKKFIAFSLIILASLALSYGASSITNIYTLNSNPKNPRLTQKNIEKYNKRMDMGAAQRMHYKRVKTFPFGRFAPTILNTPGKRANVGAVGLVIFALLFSTSIKITQEWYRNEKQKQEIMNQQLISELSFLKSQVNPHFLFNTLNGIYSLANKKSDKTPGAIVTLSELMRHMLYESEKEFVDLDKEIEYLSNYIDLQKLRLSDDALLSFSIKGSMIGKMIKPMILIPFIENAFKHGVAADGTDIQIDINIGETDLSLNVKNSLSKSNTKDSTPGIG